MTLNSGSTLGTYEIIELLGAGGMGEVYRARDRKLERDVAIKVLPTAFAQDPERLSRFKREAQLLAALNHPNMPCENDADRIVGRALEQSKPTGRSSQCRVGREIRGRLPN